MNIAIVIKGSLPKLLPTDEPMSFAVGFMREEGTPFWHCHIAAIDTMVTVRELGADGADPIYQGSCSEEALTVLADAGVKIARLCDVWDGPVADSTSKEWLVAAGIEERDGYPIPAHKLAGDSHLAIGRPPEEIAKKLPI